jgi:hypothetical protein
VKIKINLMGFAMDYARYIKGFSGINSARLALWAALIFVVMVAGIAVLNSGLY